MRITLLALAVGAVLAPRAAGAQVVLEVRTGWTFVLGDAVEGGPLGDLVTGAIPVEVGAGWRFTPELTAGLRASYGFGFVEDSLADPCDAAGLECGARVLRLSLGAEYAFRGLSEALVPWAGLGVGYGWTSFAFPQAGQEATVTYSGWELVLEAGADHAWGALEVGPFVSCALGRFGSASIEVGGDEASDGVDARGTHAYLTAGVRGRFGL